jgi:hypothetical protein
VLLKKYSVERDCSRRMTAAIIVAKCCKIRRGETMSSWVTNHPDVKKKIETGFMSDFHDFMLFTCENYSI